MSGEALNNKQFGVEQSLMRQGNMDELRSRVAGFQTMTSNLYKPSFSSDYTNVQSMRSPAAAQPAQGEDEEE